MKKININKINKYIPFIILFGILILFHYNLRITGDDLIYSEILKYGGYKNLIYFVSERYFEWSSRFIIEINLMSFLIIPMKVWKVVETLILVLIPFITVKLFKNKDSFNKRDLIKNIIASILLLIFFYSCILEFVYCGWISVSVNYIWPFFFILLHFYILKEYILKDNFKNKYLKILSYILAIFSLIYACNHEQGLISFIFIYGLIILYNYYKGKKINKNIYLMILLIVISALIIFLSPGNYERYFIESGIWFPEYKNYTLLNKIDLSLSSINRFLFMDESVITIVFFGMLGIYNYLTSKNIKTSIISFIPFIICFISNLLVFLGLSNYIKFITNGNTLQGLFASGNMYYIFGSLFLLILVAISLIYAIYKIKNTKIRFIIMALLILVVGMNFMVGFTPTIWASRGRMFILPLGFLFISTYILINDLIDNKIRFVN
ncbi:DUF6056 family protein [Methanobrevibacter sp. OttesenSCG-928-K11]|nr:DUF6056 family protein [Methanobrevibacter sp. OttesenSCG-928-K11]MDL2270380.1 DUF6056 family protein [Methanobrevibacter sp. OttesenSCG-928-I08]